MSNCNCEVIVSSTCQPVDAQKLDSQIVRPSTQTDSISAGLKSSVTHFLKQIGTTLLQQKQNDWVDVETICDLSRQHGIKLAGHHLGRDELEGLLKEFFHEQDEFNLDGLGVAAWNRRVKWDLVFMVRFHKSNLNSQPTNLPGEAVVSQVGRGQRLPLN